MALKLTVGLHVHAHKLAWLYNKSRGSSRREGCVRALELFDARLLLTHDRRREQHMLSNAGGHWRDWRMPQNVLE
jgi:hypothetical protein